MTPTSRWTRLGASVVAVVVPASLLLATGCSSKPKADTARFCSHYTAATQVAASLQHLDAVALPDIQRQVAGADTEAHAAVAVAPAGVEAPAADLAAALHRFRVAVDRATTHVAVAEAAKQYRLDAATLVTAQAQVNAWTKANCGLSADVPSTTTP